MRSGRQLPSVVWHNCRAGDEIAQRRNIGRGSFGALARNQIEIRKLLLLVSRCDQRSTAVELIDDLENRLFPLLRRSMRGQQPADSEMRLGAPLFRDQRIGRFLNAVMKEAIECFLNGARVRSEALPADCACNSSSESSRTIASMRELRAAAQAGEPLQDLLRARWAGGVSLPTMRSTTLSV